MRRKERCLNARGMTGRMCPPLSLLQEMGEVRLCWNIGNILKLCLDVVNIVRLCWDIVNIITVQDMLGWRYT